VRALVSSLQGQSARPGGDDAERGLSMAAYHDHALGAALRPEFENGGAVARAVGQSWRVDETYVKIRASGATCNRARRTGRAGRSTSG